MDKVTAYEPRGEKTSNWAQDGPKIESFEDVLNIIKPLGKWQGWVWGWIAWIQFWAAAMNLCVVFYGITPEFHCDLGRGKSRIGNWSFAEMQNISSPLNDEGELDTCKMRNISFESLEGLSFEDAYIIVNGSDSSSCNKFVFDNTVDMELTIVNQWDLVCDKKFLVEHSQLVYMFGFLVGSFVSGQLSDFFGRKLTYVVVTVMMSIFGAAQGFSPSYGGFLAIRFFTAFFVIAQTMTSFCLANEITTNRNREYLGGLFWIPYALGYASVSIFAYLLPDWRYLQLTLSLPNFISLIYYWILPESPRWLLLKNKTEEAKKVLEKAARLNGATLPAGLDFAKVAEVVKQEAKVSSSSVSYFHIFKYRVLALRALNVYFQWFACALIYYGISLNVSNFEGSRYLNNAVAGLIEIPASILTAFALKWSRKKGLGLTLFIAGVCLVILPWINKDLFALKMTLAMIGKLAITMSFGIVYVLPLEMFPTLVRNASLSSSSCISRIGSGIAPYVAGMSKLGKVYGIVGILIMGGLALMAFIFSFFLPETKGKKLPDSFQQAIHLEDEDKIESTPVSMDPVKPKS